jgi:hypothetical protein
MNKEEFARAVKNVYDASRKLKELCGGIRPFPPDGRIVGDIGEAIAYFFFQVELHPVGRHDWDGKYNGRHVQVRATAGEDNGTYLKLPEGGCDDGLLMVFKIDKDTGTYETVYNGDLQRAWDKYGHLKGNVQLKCLRELKKSVEQKDVVPEREASEQGAESGSVEVVLTSLIELEPLVKSAVGQK